MTEEQAFEFFKSLRFATNGGKPFCPNPSCKRCDAIYTYRPRWNRARTTFRTIFKCKNCQEQFTATSDTPLRYHKMTFKQILCAIWDFVVGVSNGFPALSLSLKHNYDYKSAWAFLHKLREAMMHDQASIVLSGEVEIDGTEIGGYVKPKNARKEKGGVGAKKEKKNAYRLKKFGATKCIVFVARERGGAVRTTVVQAETDAKPWIRAVVSKRATLHADLASDFDDLAWHFDHPDQFKRINHSENFWTGDCHTNNAENYNAMLEHMQGVYRRISHPKYRCAYAEEMAWRLTNKKMSMGEKFSALVQAIGYVGLSSLKGIWTRRAKQGIE